MKSFLTKFGCGFFYVGGHVENGWGGVQKFDGLRGCASRGFFPPFFLGLCWWKPAQDELFWAPVNFYVNFGILKVILNNFQLLLNNFELLLHNFELLLNNFELLLNNFELLLNNFELLLNNFELLLNNFELLLNNF